jgi:hypothetical protein
VIPTLPLRERNRLAETILAALHDAGARRELIALAADVSRWRQWLGDETRHGEALRARASRAVQALATRPLTRAAEPGRGVTRDSDSLETALDDAALLFDAGLYFEVHELLEPHWQEASGEARETLQGLIQIAVGYQHLANGNIRGAHALLAAGARRNTGGAINGRPLESFAQHVLASAAGGREPIPPFPRRI